MFGLSFNKTVSTCDKTGKNRVVLSMCLGPQLLILPLLLSASLSLPMYLLLFGVCLCGAFFFGQARSMSLVQPTPDFSFVSAFVLLMSFY